MWKDCGDDEIRLFRTEKGLPAQYRLPVSREYQDSELRNEMNAARKAGRLLTTRSMIVQVLLGLRKQ